MQVPQETLEFIATRIASNIRELEGALIRVTAFASLSGVPITTELAQNLLADLLGDSNVKPRTDEELLAEIGGDPRLRRRRAEGQEPPASPRHGPPDRDVRVPRTSPS